VAIALSKARNGMPPTGKDIARFQEAVKDRRDAEEDVNTKTDELIAARKALSRLNADIGVKEPSREQFGQREELRQRVGRLVAEREQLQQVHSDYVGEVERLTPDKLLGQREAAATPEYYQFASHPIDPHSPVVSGQNFVNLMSYIQARIHAGTAGKDLRALSTGTTRTVSRRVKEAARASLRAISEETNQRYERMVEHYADVLKTGREVGARAFEPAERIAQHLHEQVLMDMPFLQRAAEVDRMFAAGKLTEQQAVDHHAVIEQERRDAQRTLDAHNRGIAGFSHAQLGAVVAENSSAQAVMNHLAKTQPNPIVRAVARLLASQNNATKIDVIENPDFNGGRYVPATDRIEIGRGGMNPITLMHEQTHALAHAAISRALGNMGRAFGDITPQVRAEVEAVRELRNIMNTFQQKADMSNPAHLLALTDEHEFLAEALNNPTIQRALDGAQGGLLSRVWKAVAKFLGLPSGQQSQFGRLMEITPTLFGKAESTERTFNRPLQDIESAWQTAVSVAEKGQQLMQRYDLNRRGRELRLGLQSMTHMQWGLERLQAAAKSTLPKTAHDVIDQIHKPFKDFFDTRNLRTSLLQSLGQESSNYVKDMERLMKQDPDGVRKMFTLATEASRLDIDPTIPRTNAGWEAAQRLHKGIKREAFFSDESRAMRKQYEAIEQSNPKLVETYLNGAILNKARYLHPLTNNIRTLVLNSGFAGAPKVQAALAKLDMRDMMQMPARERVARMESGRSELNAALSEQMDGVLTEARNKFGAWEGDADAGIAYLNSIAKGLKGAGDSEAAGAMAKRIASINGVHDAVGTLHDIMKERTSAPYFHLGRDGPYFVRFTVQDAPGAWDAVGKVVEGLDRVWGVQKGADRGVFMRFDNELQHNDAIEKLKSVMPHMEQEEGRFEAGLLEKKTWEVNAADPLYVRKLISTINEMPGVDADLRSQMAKAAYELWITNEPETSSRKSQISREGKVGYSNDILQTYSNRQVAANNVSANSYVQPLFAQALADIGAHKTELEGLPGAVDVAKQLQSYQAELKQRYSNMMQPVVSPVLDRVRSIGSLWYLSLSPGYMLNNMLQPYHLSLPVLGARHGFTNAAGSMMRNTGTTLAILQHAMSEGWNKDKGAGLMTKIANISDASVAFGEIKNKNGTPLLNDGQVQLLTDALRSGILDFTQANEIGRLAKGDPTLTAKGLQIATVMGHYSEVANRLTTLLSAHELGTKRGMDYEHARDHAFSVTNQTQLNYSDTNVARLTGRHGFLGKVTPLVLAFQQYGFQVTELLSRLAIDSFTAKVVDKDGKIDAKASRAAKAEAARGLIGVLGTTSVIAGSMGLPFVGVFTGLVNSLGSLFGDPDDPPSVEVAYRQFLKDALGSKGGELAAHGLIRSLGVDVSQRAGLDDILPGTAFLKDRRKATDALAEGAQSFMGPAPNALMGLWIGADALKQGNYSTAIQQMLPAALRGPARATWLAQYGYTSPSGNQIPLDASPGAVAAQALGFTTAAKAEQGEASFDLGTHDMLLKRRAEAIRTRAYNALENGDYGRLQNLFESLVHFNVTNPQYAINLQGGLRTRAEERSIAATSGTGVLTTKRLYPQLPNYSF
jgi:hypothetical protein